MYENILIIIYNNKLCLLNSNRLTRAGDTPSKHAMCTFILKVKLDARCENNFSSYAGNTLQE